MTDSYHQLFGLSLVSELPLPRIGVSVPHPPGVQVRRGQPPGDLSWRHTGPWSDRAAADGQRWLRLRYARDLEWVEFTIGPNGERVWIENSADADDREVGELLLGPVISGILAQRGDTCLHAAVLRIDGAVIALIGEKGAGKSTLALALLQHGAQLVADDIAVLGDSAGRVTITPGPPRLRIGRDSADFLGVPFDGLAPVWADLPDRIPKRYYESSRDFPDEPLPLDAAYVLAPRRRVGPPVIEPISAAQGLPVLMSERHMPYLRERADDARDFGVLARVVRSVRLAWLHRADDLADLERCVDAVGADIASVVSAAGRR